MTGHLIEEELKQQVCESVQLHPKGVGRCRVSVPFMFNDGDLLVIVLKQVGEH
jgi:hypothetical protein